MKSVGQVHPGGLSVYLHVPYCQQICNYCDFNVRRLPSKPPWEALGRSMDRELVARAPAFCGAITSVYFGGGTPSLAPVAFVVARLAMLDKVFGLTAGAEITLEVDPGTVTLAKLRELKSAGITRLSLGWQSTHDRLLSLMGRNHRADASQQVVFWARQAGFNNISLDLIYAVPTQTEAELAADLYQVGCIAPEHVSLYAMTYYAKTMMGRKIISGALRRIDETTELRMGENIVTRLAAQGLARYEVSNFARSGYQSRHNEACWRGDPYLALGPGAHSFARHSWHEGWRWEGLRSPSGYIKAWDLASFCTVTRGIPLPQDTSVTFVEHLGGEALAGERVMLGLRRSKGFSLGAPEIATYLPNLQRGIEVLIARGWLAKDGEDLVPTASGMLHADIAPLELVA